MSVEIPDAPDVFRQALREGAPVFTDNERVWQNFCPTRHCGACLSLRRRLMTWSRKRQA